MLHGKVIKRARGEDGRPIGKANNNPMLDTRKYEVELSDGTIAEYYANVIGENLYSQVDSDGRQFVLLQEFLDYKKDGSALHKDDGWITSRTGQRSRKKTTAGWKFRVQWKDGSSSWVPLKDLKESFPVETAEYAKSCGLEEEPAFAWWINQVLRKRHRILAKVKSRYWMTTHKLGWSCLIPSKKHLPLMLSMTIASGGEQ